nr:flagellar basal-body MS-ring/collar protein FliF [Enterovirga rhinocerotis]
MGAVTLALVGFFAFVILRVSQPQMGVLFSDLSAGDAAAIVKDLDARGVRTETRDDGATILAPRADIPKLRMDLASKSLPSGGGVGYEIFDKGDAFSSTSFVQGVNALRALEGELARTIRTIGRVQSARIHLALPERRLFERDREPPRASIVLRTRGELSADQVGAIRHLVASAVQGLSPDKISIVDERGRLLAGAGQGDVPAASAAAADDRRVALEQRLRGQLEEILTGIVGPGRSRVQVAAELDLNRVESRHETFDPESRVLRSSQNRSENSNSASTEGQVSVGNELPGAREQTPSQPRETSAKSEEVVNYEISRTTRTELAEAGRVKRLSIAVAVDGVYVRGANGQTAYQPRSRDDLDRIAALVRSAVGFDKARGDQVEVVNLPFAETPAAAAGEPESFLASLLNVTRDDILRVAELGIISLLVLIVLLVVVRPMVRTIVAPGEPLLAAPSLALAGEQAAIGVAEAAPQIAAPPGAPEAPAIAVPPALGSLAPAGTEALARLGELARTNPKEAAGVLRNWMSER